MVIFNGERDYSLMVDMSQTHNMLALNILVGSSRSTILDGQHIVVMVGYLLQT